MQATAPRHDPLAAQDLGLVAWPQRSARRLAWLALVASAISIAACGHKPPPAGPAPCAGPEKLRVVVSADPDANLDDEGRGAPTHVRIYQLNGAGPLGATTLDALLRRDREILADSLLGDPTRINSVHPGAREETVLSRVSEARLLVLVGFLRNATGPWQAQVHLIDPPADHCHKYPTGVPVRFRIARGSVAREP